MKKSILCLSVLFTTFTLAAQSWSPAGSNQPSNSSDNSTNIAIDGSGNPWVVYSDIANGSKATVMKLVAGTWTVQGTAGFSAGATQFNSIAIDGSGNPWVVYEDFANGNKATVMKLVAGTWTVQGTAGFSAGQASSTSIAIDGSGNPWVVYEDFGNGAKATVMKFVAGTWTVQGTAGFSAGAVAYISMAIDGSGNPWVAYRDAANGNKATVMKLVAGTWTVQGLAGFSAGSTDYNSIAIDGSGNPWVVYQDAANGFKSTVMKLVAGTWTVQGLAGFSPGMANYINIAIDGSGKVYVVYSSNYGAFVYQFIPPTTTWTGAFSTAWATLGNWTNGVPTATTDAIIPNSIGLFSPTIASGAFACHNLSVTGSRSLSLTGGTLTVSGAISFTSTGAFTVNQGTGGTLVQTNGSSYNQTNGTAEFEFADANPSAGYRDIGSPCDGTVGDFNNSYGTFTASGTDGVNCYYAYSPYPNVQVYDETHANIVNGDFAERWVSATAGSHPLTAGQGLAVRSAADFKYHVQGGAFNNGDITTPVTLNNPSGTGAGWNLISDPYPSAIDLAAFLSDNPASILGDAYVFQPTGTYTGNWGSVNSAGVATVIPSANIAAGQGFFVQAPSTSTVTFHNSERNAATTTFFKTTSLSNEVRLSLTDGTTNKDQIVTYTNANATNGHDNGLDAVKIPAGSTIAMAYVLNSKDYAINAMNTIDATTVLPITMLVQSTGTFTLTADALNTPGLTAYLKDATTGTTTDLSAGPISIALTAGVASHRYSVVFAASTATGIKDIEQPVYIYANDNTIYINRASSTTATVAVYNLLGQQVITTTMTTTKLELPINNTESTIYLVTVKDQNGTETVRKVMTR